MGISARIKSFVSHILPIIGKKRSEERKYQKLFHEMHNGFALHEVIYNDLGKPVDFRYLDVNPACERIIGLQKEKVIGRTVLEIFPNTESHWIENLGRVVLSGEPALIEDFSPELGRYLQLTGFRSAKNQLAVTFMDVTERKKTEEALKKSEASLRMAQEVANVGNWNWEFNSDNLYFSDQLYRIFGYEPGEVEMSAKLASQHVHPDDLAGIAAAQRAYETPGEIYQNEHRLMRADGTMRFVISKGKVFECDEDGTPLLVIGTTQDITERKLAEQALQKSAEQHQSILKTAMDGYWMIDSAGRILEVNQTYCRMSGYSEQELLSMNALDMEALKTADEVLALAKTLAAKGQGRLESQHRRKDGTVYDIEASVQYKADDGGRYIWFIKDITERKQTEKALRASEREYRLLFDNMLDACVYCKMIFEDDRPVDYIHLKVNNAHEKLTGQSGWEGKRVTEVIPDIWETNPELFEIFGRVVKTGRSERFPYYFKAWSLWFTVSAYSAGDDVFIVIFDNITDRKQTELELGRIRKSLEDAQRLANVGSWEWNLKTNFLWLSDELYRIYGRDKSNGPPDMDNLYRSIHPDDIEYLENAIRESFQTGTFQADYRLLTSDTKEIREVHCEGEVIFDDKGKPVTHLGVVKDVTKEKRLEAQLRQAQKMESIGTLAGGIAHDFNNVLSPIIGYTELLLDEVQQNTIFESSLQEIYAAGKRARDLVKQIMDFARKSNEKKHPVEIRVIVKEVLKFMRSSIPTTIAIRPVIKSDSSVLGNATQIHQVLMNLCTNAAHAMEDSGGTLTVSLKDVVIDKTHALIGVNQGDYVEIKVTDDGIGISPEIIGSIFDPYFTTKGLGRGTGMGLAVAHGIVESHGGKISVESQLGRGTTFTIYLPLTKKRTARRSHQPDLSPSGSERILFVDDEFPVAKLGSQILERLGYSVTTCTSSLEALEFFKANPHAFDLVITDMTMPNMTGDKLAKKLMQIRPEISVIICTGYSEKLSAETAAQIGIKAFAYKPVSKADLAKAVRKVLNGEGRRKKIHDIFYQDDG